MKHVLSFPKKETINHFVTPDKIGNFVTFEERSTFSLPFGYRLLFMRNKEMRKKQKKTGGGENIVRYWRTKYYVTFFGENVYVSWLTLGIVVVIDFENGWKHSESSSTCTRQNKSLREKQKQ